jgi:hypothetical protein
MEPESEPQPDTYNHFINAIKRVEPIVFVKFGDGEYNCIFGVYGHNCDNDFYTKKLSINLRSAFIYLTKQKNAYIGMWHNEAVINNYKKLLEPENNQPIQYVDYHLFIFDNNKELYDKRIALYKEIKNSPIKKIIICNKLLTKSKILLNIDYTIFIPLNNWFDRSFENIYKIICEIIEANNREPHIIMTSCGMSAKVLIATLHEKYPNNLYFDLGSALDLICTKTDSRGFIKSYNYDYDKLVNIFDELITDKEDWHNNTKYDELYKNAKLYLGRHL